ncbi:MAG: ShlB/FhaC/HecB family hemolysin secretion/activation protein [Vulcanococcus sp.]
MEAMPFLQCRRGFALTVSAATLLLPLPLLAQTPGSVERLYQDQQLREQLRNLRQQPTQRKPLIEGAPKPQSPQPDGGTQPEQGPPIKGVQLEGSSLFPAEQLKALQKAFIGKPASQVNLAELQADVADWYDKAKLLAHTAPPVLAVDGIVTITVVEARLGDVRVQENKSPIRSGWAIATVLNSVGLNREFRLDKLESALLKLNDLGGVEVRSSLQPGQAPGTTDVVLTLKTRDQMLGSVALNNHVVQYTGPYQAQGNVSFQGYLGQGEIFNVDGSYSGNVDWYGSRLLAGNASIPLTPGGLNLIGSYTFSDYRLLKEFVPDNYTGYSSIGTLGLSQVLWRRPKTNVSANWIAEVDQFVDKILATPYSNRTNWLSRFSLQGDHQDRRFGGVGLNSGVLTFSVGSLSKNADGENALDEQLMGAAGAWGKVNLLYDRYQTFKDSRWTLEFFAQGQVGFSNLDGVEKMSLGWPNGVRAYPPGEAAGDSGLAGQFTARYQLAKNVVFKGFVDGGYIWKWTNWFALAQSPGSLGLWGPGLGIDWGTRGDVLLSVDVAFPLGNNPGNINGLDSDGTNPDARVWVSLRKWL